MTITAGVLIGATAGAVAGRVVAQVYLTNNYASSTAIAIAERMLVGGMIGALIGLPVSALAARRLRINFRSLLVGIAVSVGVGGLFIAAAVVQPKCTRLVPVHGSTVLFTCVAQDPHVALRLSIALGSVFVALVVAWASRHTDGIGG